jgi:outer membrane protein assembly factor BamB
MRTFPLLTLLSFCGCLTAADWPQFHGPEGKGTAEAKLPLTWSDTENIIWKTELPGEGSSSPVIVGNRIFLTSGVGSAEDVCFVLIVPGSKSGTRRSVPD